MGEVGWAWVRFGGEVGWLDKVGWAWMRLRGDR